MRRGHDFEHAVMLANLLMACEAEEENEDILRARDELYGLEDAQEIENRRKALKKMIKKHAEEQANDKTYVPIEERIFVCLGTFKRTMNLTAWTMHIHKNMTDVILYDVDNHKEYLLKGRISSAHRQDLADYLYPEGLAQRTQANGMGNLLGGLNMDIFSMKKKDVPGESKAPDNSAALT
jgi:hypothetical protein